MQRYLYQVSEASRLSITAGCDEDGLRSRIARWAKDSKLAGIRVWILFDDGSRRLVLWARTPGFHW